MINRVTITDSFQALPKLKDNSVSLVLTDPPYNLDDEQKAFLHSQFTRISNSWVIVFSPPKNQWVLPADQYLFWEKQPSTKNTSRRYSNFVEMLFVYGYGTWNSKRHWSQYTNVFRDLVDSSALHPHRKPPSLIERLILNHTNEGDIILDPFSGSGVVLDVSLQSRRKCIAFEKDVKYKT